MALRVVQRLPDYLLDDLIGVGHEELLRNRLDLELHRRKPDDHLREDRDTGMKLLRLLLSRMGPHLLEIDAFRHEFIKLFSSDGYVGKKAWTGFVNSKIRTKGRRGRPRKCEYDLIYQQRAGTTPESYGKLVRRIYSSDATSHSVLLNRAKAAVAYRKRKNL